MYISSKEDITRFKEIGFALESHQKRLVELVNSFKDKAWEITLVKLVEIQGRFTSADVHRIFPYLCRRAVHDRLRTLFKSGFIQNDSSKKKARTINGFATVNSPINLYCEIRTAPKKAKTNPLKSVFLEIKKYLKNGSTLLIFSSVEYSFCLKLY